MKKSIIYVLTAMLLSVMLVTCQHVDNTAQRAADAELIDRGTANFISTSARAFASAAESISPEQEYFIGRAVAANILSTYPLWDGDPQLVNYLNLICAAIVINSPNPMLFNGYRVAILDSNEVNAFATSGGHIFITRGLINVAKTEDDLASIIAHEVAHIQLQHGIKSIRNSRVTEALLITAAAGIANVTGMDESEINEVFNESVAEITQTMIGSGYSREQEYEADIAAMYLLAYAGYQPSALLDMLAQLSDTQGRTGFGRTHPAPRSRIFFAQRAIDRFDIEDNRLARQPRFNQRLNLGVTQR